MSGDVLSHPETTTKRSSHIVNVTPATTPTIMDPIHMKEASERTSRVSYMFTTSALTGQSGFLLLRCASAVYRIEKNNSSERRNFDAKRLLHHKTSLSQS